MPDVHSSLQSTVARPYL